MFPTDLSPKEILDLAAKRRRRAGWVFLLGLPLAFGGFILAAALDPVIGQERAGLVMLGGLVGAFVLFFIGVNLYRCPSCGRIPGEWTSPQRFRLWFATSVCPHCEAQLR